MLISNQAQRMIRAKPYRVGAKAVSLCKSGKKIPKIPNRFPKKLEKKRNKWYNYLYFVFD